MGSWRRAARTSVKDLGVSSDYVYDLQTSSSHFHVAPGDLVVHNTDSAFVRLPESDRCADVEELFRIGELMAERVTERYRDSLPQSERTHCVVSLEMEKYLKPLIMYKKKKYVGLSFESAKQKEGKVLAKGVELVRRDAIDIVKSTQTRIIDELLKHMNPEAARDHVRATINQLMNLQAGGPFDGFVFSKSLKLEYSNPESMAQKKVAELMDMRNPGSAPRAGDRVEYIVVAAKGQRVVDRVESVIYAQEVKLPPDWPYYLEVLKKPMLRFLEVPLKSLGGSHMEDLQTLFEDTMVLANKKKMACLLQRNGAVWQRENVPLRQALKIETPPPDVQESSTPICAKQNYMWLSERSQPTKMKQLTLFQTPSLLAAPSKPDAKKRRVSEPDKSGQKTLHDYL